MNTTTTVVHATYNGSFLTTVPSNLSEESRNCSAGSGKNDGLEEDIPVVLFSAISIVFNILILATNIYRRQKSFQQMEMVLIHFTVLALTDMLASVTMLTHYSIRMTYSDKYQLVQMLNEKFNSSHNLFEGGSYVSYLGPAFMLIKKKSATCGKLFVRYFTLRWFTEASNRLLMVYMNISRTNAIYSSKPPKKRSEIGNIVRVFVITFVIPGVFMASWVLLIVFRAAPANYVMYVIYGITYVLPFFILLVTSILLIKKIKNTGAALKKVSNSKKMSGDERRKNKAERNKDQLMIMVVVVTIAYLVTHLPGLIHMLGKTKMWKTNDLTNSILSRIGAVMMAVNSLTNFPIFLLLSDQFLLGFRQMFGYNPRATTVLASNSNRMTALTEGGKARRSKNPPPARETRHK